MVRVKHRYLVAQILYPEQQAISSSASTIPATAKQVSRQSAPSIIEFHRPTPPGITAAHLARLVRDTIAELFGDAGAGLCNASLALKYFSAATSTLILRCARERAIMVWAALMFITHLPAVEDGRYRAGAKGLPCVVRVVHHSGTIRKCEEKIIELARRDILRVQDGESADLLERIIGAGASAGGVGVENEDGGLLDDGEDEVGMTGGDDEDISDEN